MIALLALALVNITIGVVILRRATPPRRFSPAPESARQSVPLGAEPRFRVERVGPENQRDCAYFGNDGSLALMAWEFYQHGDLPGQFVFVDRLHPAGHRGQFTRLSN